MGLQRRRLNFDREKQVIINLILNTEFCTRILPVIDYNYFNSKHAKILINWVQVFYEEYGTAPGIHIKDIFDTERVFLDEEEEEQVASVLHHLSEVAESAEAKNVEVLVDNANDLFRERHLVRQKDALEQKLHQGDIVGAENVVNLQYSGVVTKFDFIDFSDMDYIRKVVRSMIETQELDNAFFTFSGRFGEFIGAVNRGWFVAFLAPAKKGKTTYMMEAVISGMLKRLNVVLISLEMPIDQLYARFLLSVTGQKPEDDTGSILSPIMDCAYNQDGSCEKDKRVWAGSCLCPDTGDVLPYHMKEEWEVCTECRGTPDFSPTAWVVPVEKEYYNEEEYVKKAYSFSRLYGKYCRAIHKPSRSCTVEDLQAEVDLLINKDNFIPDVIVIDYADLLNPSQNTGQKRHDLDDIWERLRAWGQSKDVLIITASQTNRMSADAPYMKDTHVAEDYSKIAKLDIAIGLCQNDQDKEMGIMRLNKVAHRHKEYVISHTCTVLQELTYQQAILDSEFQKM